MNEESETQINRLRGEQAANVAMLLALIASHPEPQRLHALFEKFAELTVAKSLPRAVPDESIEFCEALLTRYAYALQQKLAAG